MQPHELALLHKGYQLQPDGSWSRPDSFAGCVAPDAKRQQDPVNERVAEAPGANPDKKRRLVRFTSCRLRLADQPNLWIKHYLDSLVEAGILVDDSPRWVEVEVLQKIAIIDHVLIEVFDL